MAGGRSEHRTRPAPPLSGVQVGILRSELMALLAMRSTHVRVIAPFCVHVAHVVEVGAQKEMVGVHAGRIVATVQDAQAGRDRTSVQRP